MPVRAVYIAIVLLCAGGGLFAQPKNEDNTTRTVEGMVSDAANQPVAKAVVQLKNTKTLQIRSFITQDDGSYHFAGLGTDVEYQLKADHDGASTSWKTLSVFNSKKTAVINLKLRK
ncbi:MAG TPA: carboxypeptidase-like regulatory domain-containing protein [Bryobacteraceae bacterium]|nr:carboxypeptidase-like regulatory domain-containing protein [Bryobacteraceae bacterium]